MIKNSLLFLFTLAYWTVACLPATAQSKTELQVFAPGVVSGGAVFGVTFTPDGRTVYFCETDPEIKHIQIMESHNSKGEWQKAVPAPFSPGVYRDIDPFVTAGGKRLIFNTNRPPDGKGEALKTFDIYVMDRKADGRWGAPRRLQAVNTDASEVFATESRNGDLYFGSDRPGGKGKVDIYMAKTTPDGYAGPVPLEGINTGEVESNPLIAPDESYLIFASQVDQHNDLFVSYREGEQWSKPVSLGPRVNTEDDEYAPAFSPDHKLLYFTRTRFENNKRVKPGTIYSVPVAQLKLRRK
jgi:Tol biopolymer transport system component